MINHDIKYRMGDKPNGGKAQVSLMPRDAGPTGNRRCEAARKRAEWSRRRKRLSAKRQRKI